MTWFAAIMASGFINLNVGHNGYKRWFACFVAKKGKDRSFVVLKVSRKGSEVFCCCCLHRVHAAWNEFTVASFRRPRMKWATIQVMTQLQSLTSTQPKVQKLQSDRQNIKVFVSCPEQPLVLENDYRLYYSFFKGKGQNVLRVCFSLMLLFILILCCCCFRTVL